MFWGAVGELSPPSVLGRFGLGSSPFPSGTAVPSGAAAASMNSSHLAHKISAMDPLGDPPPCGALLLWPKPYLETRPRTTPLPSTQPKPTHIAGMDHISTSV